RRFKNGEVDSILTPYAAAVREVAAKTKTPLIDLHRSSVELFNELGDEGSAYLCPEGDRTHLNKKGAEKISDLIISGFPSELSELAARLKS
ncbi:MAG: pectin esterase, partial [Rubripirellula sp.]|nr:pectin esterase [Rubripirellula sp.]